MEPNPQEPQPQNQQTSTPPPPAPPTISPEEQRIQDAANARYRREVNKLARDLGLEKGNWKDIRELALKGKEISADPAKQPPPPAKPNSDIDNLRVALAEREALIAKREAEFQRIEFDAKVRSEISKHYAQFGGIDTQLSNAELILKNKYNFIDDGNGLMDSESGASVATVVQAWLMADGSLFKKPTSGASPTPPTASKPTAPSQPKKGSLDALIEKRGFS